MDTGNAVESSTHPEKVRVLEKASKFIMLLND